MGLLIVGEGQGEKDALPNLVYRLAKHLGVELPHAAPREPWRKPLVTETQVREVGEQARALAGCEGLLLTRDADNDDLPAADCPKFHAPMVAGWARSLALPFPTAVVLFYKEFETLFLAGADGMAGREVRDRRGEVLVTISAGVVAPSAPEAQRDAKGWVRDNLVPGYKPTLHQASLTQLLDLDDMERRALPSYRRLMSAVRFLAAERATAGKVYPGA